MTGGEGTIGDIETIGATETIAAEMTEGAEMTEAGMIEAEMTEAEGMIAAETIAVEMMIGSLEAESDVKSALGLDKNGARVRIRSRRESKHLVSLLSQRRLAGMKLQIRLQLLQIQHF